MGRRQGGLSDLLNVAARLPWKVSVALAPVSFVVLHVIAAMSVQTGSIADLSQMGPVVVRGYVHTFATILQFIFPVAFLLGAAASFVKGSRSTDLYEGVRGGARVASLSWREFEALVGEGFRGRGFKVSQRGGSAPDGGVDLV